MLGDQLRAARRKFPGGIHLDGRRPQRVEMAGAGAERIGGGAIESLLYGVAGRDLVTLLAVGATLTGVALVALVGPALRASRTDPALVLSAE